MNLAGIYSRLSGGRYDTAIAILEGDQIVEHTHFTAQAHQSESNQLSELYVRAHELLRPRDAGIVAVWSQDPAPGGKSRLSISLANGRAEGAVLAAAGQLGWDTGWVSGAGV